MQRPRRSVQVIEVLCFDCFVLDRRTVECLIVKNGPAKTGPAGLLAMAMSMEGSHNKPSIATHTAIWLLLE